MTHVVVMGAGVAGIPAAYRLRERLGNDVSVTVIAPREEFTFVPSHPWVAVGWRDPASISVPLRPEFESRGIAFVPQLVVQVDAAANEVVLGNDERVGYDYLLIATGIRPAWERVPGLETGERPLQSVVTIEDAQATRSTYDELLRSPGPIVICAAQGASIFGPMYEYAFLVDADLRRRGLRGRVPITVVTPEPYPGHLGLRGGQVREVIEHALAAHDISVIPAAEIVGVESVALHLRVHGSTAALKTRLVKYAFAVCWPPFAGIRALEKGSESLANDLGLIHIDEFLRSPSHPNVFAVGTCVARPSETPNAPIPLGAPHSVYSIQQEVRIAVDNIFASLQREPLQTAEIERARWITDTGERGAEYLSAPQIPLRDVNWLKGGRWVHEAKVEFERYFIDQVVRSGVSGSHVHRLFRSLAAWNGDAGAGLGAPSNDAPLGSLPTDTLLLRAIAERYGIEERRLTSQLVRAAVEDGLGALNGEERAELLKHVRELRVAELDEEEERVRFEGGAP